MHIGMQIPSIRTHSLPELHLRSAWRVQSPLSASFSFEWDASYLQYLNVRRRPTLPLSGDNSDETAATSATVAKTAGKLCPDHDQVCRWAQQLVLGSNKETINADKLTPNL